MLCPYSSRDHVSTGNVEENWIVMSILPSHCDLVLYICMTLAHVQIDHPAIQLHSLSFDNIVFLHLAK